MPRSKIVAQQRTSMADIAKLAGVSVPTVSKVLRRRYDGSSETRTLIESLLQSHGYVIHTQPQEQSTTRSSTISIVMHLLGSPYELELIRGIDMALKETHDRLVLLTYTANSSNQYAWLDQLQKSLTQGALVNIQYHIPQLEQTLQQRDIPYIMLDEQSQIGPNIPSVGVNNLVGGRIAVEYLISLGHRRIAIIVGPKVYLSANDRLIGYKVALGEAEITIDTDLIRQGQFTEEEGIDSGYRETMALLSLPNPPTAIFASNDTQAIGVYKALFERGISIPNQMSVIGFDDIPIAAQMLPPLTTVRQPLFEMGRVAVSMLQRLLEHKSLDSTRVELPTTLVVRRSCSTPHS
jgi:LacI family transcriptional regulator